MRYKICNIKYDDFIIVEGETIEEIREIAMNENNKRGWQDKDCWSEKIED